MNAWRGEKRDQAGSDAAEEFRTRSEITLLLRDLFLKQGEDVHFQLINRTKCPLAGPSSRHSKCQNIGTLFTSEKL